MYMSMTWLFLKALQQKQHTSLLFLDIADAFLLVIMWESQQVLKICGWVIKIL